MTEAPRGCRLRGMRVMAEMFHTIFYFLACQIPREEMKHYPQYPASPAKNDPPHDLPMTVTRPGA